MKKHLLAASVFLFGLGLGGTAAAFSAPGGTSITPEQSECIGQCTDGGEEPLNCFRCCVRNICV